MMNKYLSYILPLLLVALLPACSDSAVSDIEPEPGPALKPGVAFAVQRTGIGSRVGYDGLSSWLEEGEKVGCVIASIDEEGNPTYLTNSCWTYHETASRKGGDLILLSIEDTAQQDLVVRTESDDTNNPFVKLREGADYAFCFYYPYLDEAQLKEDAQKSYGEFTDPWGGIKMAVNGALLPFPNLMEVQPNSWTSILIEWLDQNDMSKIYEQSLVFPPASADTLAGNVKTHAAWTDFPVYVLKNQNPDGVVSTGNTRLNRSDFMWSRPDKELNLTINSSSKGVIPVTFTKLFATIDVEFTEELDVVPTDLYFQGGALEYSYKKLQTGKKFNLFTGKLTNFDPIGQQPTATENATYYDGKITPSKLDEKGLLYRVILPPMAVGEFICALHFTVNGEEKTIDKIEDNKKLNKLESNTYYKIRMVKNPDSAWSIEIADWISGGSQTLERPDK